MVKKYKHQINLNLIKVFGRPIYILDDEEYIVL